jgi:nucleoside-diphosphate-sugar epimerase
MRVFVTGATGLLGSNIVNAFLTAGHAVKALARTPAKTAGLYASGDVTVVQGDLGAIGDFAGQLAGCDLLVHAAAYFREYYAPGDHWDLLYRTNVDGTRDILSVTGATALVTPEAIRTLQEDYDMSSAKAMRELGAAFRPLEETLRDEIAWFRQRQVH